MDFWFWLDCELEVDFLREGGCVDGEESVMVEKRGMMRVLRNQSPNGQLTCTQETSQIDYMENSLGIK